MLRLLNKPATLLWHFQHENTAPREYFQRLIESFEERMFLYRRQVEEVESHLASLQQPQIASPQGICTQF